MPTSSPPPSREHTALAASTPVPNATVWPDVLAGEDLKPSPKQERGHRARESLLRAAETLFAQNGYDATSVEEIAKAAGTAVGGFYRHFRSKRQVLLVSMRRLLDEFDARYSARLLNEGSVDAFERMRQDLRMRWMHVGVYRAWREAVVRDPALAVLHEAIEAVVKARMVSTLAIVASAPWGRSDVDLSMLATVVNVLFWRLLDAPAGERHAVSETMMMLVRRALFEDPPEP